MTISMLMAVFALMAISVPIMHFALKYNVVMIAIAFVLECLASKWPALLYCLINNILPDQQLTPFAYVKKSLLIILLPSTALSGFLGWLVFAIKHDTRNWLQYPSYNYLDWAFYVAVLSSVLNGAAAALFAIEGRKAYAKRQRFTNLVYNMHPRFTTT